MLAKKMFWFFEALAAGYENPDDYEWMTYTSDKSLHFGKPDRRRNRKHDLNLVKGDVFGIRQTRVRDSWYLVRADSMHVIFKMKQADIDLIDKRSKPTKAPGKLTGKVERKRKVSDQQRFKKRGVSALREKVQIDKSNYQWRKIIEGPVSLRSPKGKEKAASFNTNEVIGLRFVNAAKGGFLVTERGVRMRVNAKTYDEVVDKSFILEPQPRGLIDVNAEELRKELARQRHGIKEELKPTKSVLKRGKKVEEKAPKPKKGSGIQRRTPGDLGDFEELEDRVIEDEELQITPAKPSPRLRKVKPVRQKPVRRTQKTYKTLEDEAEFERAYKDTVKDDMPELDDEDTDAIEKSVPTRYRNNPDQKRQKAAKKIAIKKTKAGIKQAVQEDNDFDVGDVLVFNKDPKQREYLVVAERLSEESDNIVEYLIYNLTEEPEYLQSFRHDVRKTKLSSTAKKVRVIKHMKKYENYPDEYDISKLSPYK